MDSCAALLRDTAQGISPLDCDIAGTARPGRGAAHGAKGCEQNRNDDYQLKTSSEHHNLPFLYWNQKTNVGQFDFRICIEYSKKATCQQANIAISQHESLHLSQLQRSRCILLQ